MRSANKLVKLNFLLITMFGLVFPVTKSSADKLLIEPGGTEFDPEPLKMRGLDPALADLFRHAPRFISGTSNVELYVNGIRRGWVKARFDDTGELCADEGFWKDAGLVILTKNVKAGSCLSIKDAWPQAELNLNPAQQRIDLVVPTEAMDKTNSPSVDWKHGGGGAMLNYDAQYLDSSGGGAGVSFLQFNSEGGFNFDDWIIRSRQTFSRFNDVDTLTHQSAYAQRSFMSTQQVFQAGQISLSNSIFTTGQVLGLQLFPEAALQTNPIGPALVEGIAESQSVVEVRQLGVLVYSTTVPAGPFKLNGLSLLNTRSDLEVTLTSTNGDQRQFIVPASALLRRGHTVVPGFSFGLGRMEQEGSNLEPLVATLAKGWGLSPFTTLQAGILKSSTYQAGGAGLDSQIADRTTLSLQGIIAEDLNHRSKGDALSAALGYQVNDAIGFSVNFNKKSAGFRELSDSIQSDELYYGVSRSSRQFGASVEWSTQRFGSFSFSQAYSRDSDGHNSVYQRGGWSKQFGRSYVGASLEQDNGTSVSPKDKRLYLTINFPLGDKGSVNGYVSQSSSSNRAGVRYSERSTRDRGWSLASDKDFHNGIVSNAGAFDLLTPVSQVSGSVTQNSNNNTSWSARSSGSVVLHEGGLTFAPYRVGDTFGVAKVGSEKGVKLETPAGPTWTDRNGYAVLPSLNGFKRSVIQVDTKSLQRNVDIGNAWYETGAARGSVNYIEFDILRTRRVLVELHDSAGQKMQRGAAVFDRHGNFITMVGDNGRVFIPDASSNLSFDVQNSNKEFCSFTLNIAEKASSEGHYENSSAQCR